MRSFAAISTLALALCSAGRICGENTHCQAPAAHPDAAANLFTPQQEIELGDVLAAEVMRDKRMADDARLVAYLNRVGERLAAQLPASDLKFRYYVLDVAAPNGFSIAGGRIYITRGLASFVRNEDELASVMAHEMGHLVAHQTAIGVTSVFREVLGVNSVAGRQDIVMDLSRAREALARNPETAKRLRGKEAVEQSDADAIGFYAALHAGYSPQAFADIFDRIAQTNGKTGNFLTDLLHTTTPDQRRLRDMMKMAQSLTVACAAAHPPAAQAEFEAWKAAVLQFSNWNQRGGQLHGVIAEVKLDGIVLRDVSRVRFSGDGKYILAREADELYIFTREPLRFAFEIKAPGAVEALFTADSKAVAFATALPHVEVWNLESQARLRSFDLLETRCAAQALSPAADVLGCLGGDETLSVRELASGARIFEKKRFGSGLGKAIVNAPPRLTFSPDGRYFLAIALNDVAGFDLSARQVLKIPAPLRDHLDQEAAFLGPDRILAGARIGQVDGTALRPFVDAGIFTFPGGKLIGSAPTGLCQLLTPTRGDYALLLPFDKYRIGVMNLKTRKMMFGVEQKAMDIYEGEYVRVLTDGDLGLFDMETRLLKARAALPKGEGAGFERAYASRQLNWVAGCGAERCAVWDARTGKRTFLVRPFKAGWFDGENFLYADFVKFQKNPRAIGRLDLHDPSDARSEPVDVADAEMVGRLLAIGKRAKSDETAAEREDPVLREAVAAHRGFLPCGKFQQMDPLECDSGWEFRDVATGKLLWSRQFPKESPAMSGEPDGDVVLLRWSAALGGAQEELKHYPALAAQLAEKKDKRELQLVEVLEGGTGHASAAMLADAAAWIRVMGGRTVAAHQGYMEIYSLDMSRKEGEILGRPGVYSTATGLMTVHSEKANEVSVYNLETREKVDDFAFASNIALCQFSADGTRLLVLTNDQTAYTLALPGVAAGAAPLRE